MPIELKPGTRLFSAVSAVEMIVVRAPSQTVELAIGGAPVLTSAADRDAAAATADDGETQIGKRYVDADNTIELLCTKAGAGTPSVDGTSLSLKDAKPLPASD